MEKAPFPIDDPKSLRHAARKPVGGVLPRARTETIIPNPDYLGEAPPEYEEPQDSWPQLRERELEKGRAQSTGSDTI